MDKSHDIRRCFYCQCAFGPLSSRWHVRKAVRPPGHPNRWRVVAYACEACADRHSLIVEDSA